MPRFGVHTLGPNSHQHNPSEPSHRGSHADQPTKRITGPYRLRVKRPTLPTQDPGPQKHNTGPYRLRDEKPTPPMQDPGPPKPATGPYRLRDKSPTLPMQDPGTKHQHTTGQLHLRPKWPTPTHAGPSPSFTARTASQPRMSRQRKIHPSSAPQWCGQKSVCSEAKPQQEGEMPGKKMSTAGNQGLAGCRMPGKFNA